MEYTQRLKEANATKDKFFSIVAHELKNPFNSILGFTDLLMRNLHKYDNEKIEQFVAAIHNSSVNTYRLLENLLDWSRSQTGRIRFAPENQIVEHIVIDVIQQTASVAKAKNITIDYEITDALTVFADENMLNTILRNLISNAIKFTKEGGKIIVRVSQNKQDALFSVRDTGIGMTTETLSKLFKIEEKVSTQGTNNERGTGLGLLLCKSIKQDWFCRVLEKTLKILKLPD